MSQKRTRINHYIKLPEVLLIDESGNKVGVVATTEALQRAKGLGLDLVEVAPNLRPPVCKILDYGKFQYEQAKSGTSNKKHKPKDIKEIRLGLKIDEHDLKIKSKKVSQFLSKGHKVKIAIRFKGREITHKELGQELLEKFLGTIETEYIVDKEPTRLGHQIVMFIIAK